MKPTQLFILIIFILGCQESPEPVSREESPQKKPQYWAALAIIDSLTEDIRSTESAWVTIDSFARVIEYENFLAQIEGPSSPAKSDYRVYEDHDESIHYVNEAGDEFSLDSLRFLRDGGVVFLLDTFPEFSHEIRITDDEPEFEAIYSPYGEFTCLYINSQTELPIFNLKWCDDTTEEEGIIRDTDYVRLNYRGETVLILRKDTLIVKDSLAAILGSLLFMNEVTNTFFNRPK